MAIFFQRERGNALSAPPASADTFSANAEPVTLRPIGVVRNGVHQPVPDGWEQLASRIVIEPGLTEALRGIEGYSHLIVLTWLHLAAAEPRNRLSLRPGGDRRLPLRGVFALRVAGRPNPIGCSVVQLTGIDMEGATLHVRGLDAVDGTLVLDIKPYLPPYDSVPEALLPSWARPN